jgi:LCP family protein required for cell wall assembly
MVIDLEPQKNNTLNRKIAPKNVRTRKHRKLKILLVIIIVFLFGGFLFIKSGYLSVTYDLFKITGNKIKRTKVEQTIHYKYDNSNKFTNILVLGSDTDQKFNPNSILTQTIMIVSFNPYLKKIYMISIPRDFWIKIPGYTQSGGYSKFDTASEIGGIQLTRQLVEQYFGIKINYYAWVGLSGFVKLINTFGGVNVVPTHPVLDWSYPNDLNNNPSLEFAAINLYISGAPQYMTGTRALEYVRSRHGDLMGDFGRSQRQQQVLRILKNKLDNPSTIAEIPSLFNSLSSIIRTDMTIPQIISMSKIAYELRNAKIQSIILSPTKYSSISTVTTLINGQYVTQDIVAPNWTAINALFLKLYGN